MATAGGNNLQVACTDLPCNILKLSCAQSMQLIRMRQISEMHAQLASIKAIYEVDPRGDGRGAMERMDG